RGGRTRPARARPARVELMRPDRPPTARQIYALSAAFCVKEGYDWPANRVEASELLGELRREIGHPRAALADNPLHPRAPRWRRYAEWELHREIADAFLQARR
ncbi:MAG TPA: hypothetical protein VJ986_00225, partial [Gaiellaceae bacterium]|nr:hypothetical protein [Gaiellaceae bacterium]